MLSRLLSQRRSYHTSLITSLKQKNSSHFRYSPSSFTQSIRFISNSNDKKDSNQLKKADSQSQKKKVDYGKKVSELTQQTLSLGKKGILSIYDFFREPTQIPTKIKSFWQMMKDEAHHYWVGTKLLWAEFKTANEIMSRVLKGHMMTRRERLQLVRTTQDLLRLVPFSVFVIVPFMELLLPLAIKLFPNMLPSTFEDSLKKEENLKKELAMRLGVASFFIETIRNMAEKKQKDGDEEATASEVTHSFTFSP